MLRWNASIMYSGQLMATLLADASGLNGLVADAGFEIDPDVIFFYFEETSRHGYFFS